MFADSAGNWSTVDSNVQIVYDITAPAAPTGLTATAGNSQATLNWSASTDSVSGVKDYIIYLNEANHATTSGTSYTVTGLSNGTSYSFRISARDNSGNEGAQAAAVSATPTAPTSSADNPITPATEDDSSPPSIIWVNLQPKQNLSGIFKIQVDAIDASGIKYISMYIDSQDEKGFVEKITSKQGTYFEFSIDTTKFSDENHSLIVVSADNAPNQHTGTSTINVNFANAKNQNNDQENNEQNKPPEKETFFSQITNFGEKDKNFINGISLEETAKQKAIELAELLKPKRKIEITKDGKKFNLKVTISFENTDLNSIKIVEIIPKEFAKSASEIGSDFNFNVLADDPIIEFDLNSLASNKTIELKYWLKADLNESAAEEIPKNTDGKFSAPIILTTDIIVSKESFNIEMEKNSSPSAFFSLENIGFLPILGAIAILGFIWVFVFSMKHPLKIIHEHAVEKNVSEEKPAETGQGTIAGETEATAKKKKSEQIKELDTVEEKLKGLRKEAN